jgi:thymidylate synthase
MSNNIPVICVKGKTIPEAYEKSIMALYNDGCRLKTQYDKIDEPPSIDATANITIEDPESEPMIYKYFPGGIEDLREYVIELQGAKNHWVRAMNDPNDKRWEYTYNQRLMRWGTWKEVDFEGKPFEASYAGAPPLGQEYAINQIQIAIKKLIEAPYSRRVQAITWMPFIDNEVSDPPCLQSMWFRMLRDETWSRSNNTYYLNTNIRFRSNDAWGAAFMNMFGLMMFIRNEVANPIATGLGTAVKLGRINWQADSFHIYGKDIKDVEQKLLPKLSPYSFGERVYSFNDPMIQDIWKEAEVKIFKKIADYDAEQNKPVEITASTLGAVKKIHYSGSADVEVETFGDQRTN